MLWTGTSSRSYSSDSEPSDLSDADKGEWARCARGSRTRSKKSARNERSSKTSSLFSFLSFPGASSKSKKRSGKKGKKKSNLRSRLGPMLTSQGCGVIFLALLLSFYMTDFFSLLIRRSAKVSNTKPHKAVVNSLGEDNSVSPPTQRIAKSSLTNFSNRSSFRFPSKPRTNEQRRREGSSNDAARSSHSFKEKTKDLGSSASSEQAEKIADAAAKDIRELSKHPMNRNSLNLQVPGDTGILTPTAVREYYRKLSKAYLETFKGGIYRQMFFDILRRRTYSLTPPGANKGVQTILFQIVDGKVYMMDPYEVPRNSKPFYRTRINEVIWLLSRLAGQRRLKNTEFLMAIHDCVQTVNKDHTYRGAHFSESNPAFTIVSCNFSNNIPFPMWEGSKHRDGGFSGWDETVKQYATDEIVWDEKQNRAVFRGGNRPSMFFRNKSDADHHCHDVGRTRLLYLSQQKPDVLDVSIGGTCAGVHTRLRRLEPKEHHKYKYILYAEGNCMWADRLRHQVFGPSLIIKQETPCGQFFEPLLKPSTHYMSTNFFFTDTVEKIMWARQNDHMARNIVKNANEFARNFLSLEGIETYVEILLQEYTALLVEPDIKLENGAVEVTNKHV